jgi:DNA-binding MarR family transcriptional regulator
MVARSNGSSMNAGGDVRGLLMFRISRLATIGERTGQLRVSRKFGLNLGEWRALGLIHALEPVTLAELAGELYLDKGQISRSVSDLIRKGLVSHSASLQDRRQTLFVPTAAGRQLHSRVLAFTSARNSIITQCLSAREKAELSHLLDKVTKAAVQSFDEIFGRQARQTAERDIAGGPPRSKLAARLGSRQRAARETLRARPSRAPARVRKLKSAGAS